jgi:hypothetical protein
MITTFFLIKNKTGLLIPGRRWGFPGARSTGRVGGEEHREGGGGRVLSGYVNNKKGAKKGGKKMAKIIGRKSLLRALNPGLSGSGATLRLQTTSLSLCLILIQRCFLAYIKKGNRS